MWRRTIKIPSNVQLMFDREIKLVINGLWEAEGVREWKNVSAKNIPGRRRRRQEQSPHATSSTTKSPISNSTNHQSSVYRNLSNFLRQKISASPPGELSNRIQKALQTASDTSASLNNLPALQLSRSYQYRAQLIEICTELGILNTPFVRKALEDDEKHISVLLQQTIAAKDFGRKAVLRLQKRDAESFADILQMILDKHRREGPSFWRGARRLLVKLSEISGVIPKSLTIYSITLLEKEAIFGGGFADIYRASYEKLEVAVKRMRVFQRGQDHHKIHRTFCKEALLWRSFRHPHVLPFLGVDSKTFSPYLCMVSPWMRHGTIMRHLSENEGVDVKKLLREVAQGLDYLHSQKVVHGDLRGSNILINEEWQACLADFGLAVVSDSTMGSQTSNSHGSVRWMAPELHDPESFGFSRFIRTFASDIYAFGCVCFEVHTGRAPFADIVNDSAVMLQVLRGARPQRTTPETLRHISDDVWRLIQHCWRQTPSERLDIRKVVDITEWWR
ncbi:kinase-like domain-containing protein [Collybia nuda]|uniref:Kinase-like domain-containing protein n=1 Tax=Collybia nuda TaxID=64659 RepID=A0A9P6CCR5_9AGAR|nr:kinase-like domain-containing protein [Collybia nuda]